MPLIISPFAFLGSGLITFIILKIIINKSKIFASGNAREFLDMGNHALKKHTPSMGGLAFIISTLIFYLHSIISKNYSNNFYIYNFIIFNSILSGIIGFIDDYKKKIYRNGLSVKEKFIYQGIIAILGSSYLYYFSNYTYSTINFGFFEIHIGILYIVWASFIIIGTSHAVNITDGIDGLATSQVLLSFIAFILILKNQEIELIQISFYIYGMLSTFLQFNKNPAKIFMGDSGSLFLGSLLSSIFLIKKIEILLIFSGIVFVIETFSVIIQVLYFKKFNKRFFLFAPIHHALEKKGFSEKKIFYTAAYISCVGQILTLILYKKLY